MKRNNSLSSGLVGRTNANAGVQPITLADDALKFIFSWVALMPIAIIVSGRYLGQLFKLPGRRRQFFQVSIPHVINLRAQDDEVIFGFSVFLIYLVAIGLADGKGASALLKSDFGPNLGQFNALCVLSAFATGVSSIAFYSLTRTVARLRHRTDTIARMRDQLISDLSEGSQTGGNSDG